MRQIFANIYWSLAVLVLGVLDFVVAFLCLVGIGQVVIFQLDKRGHRWPYSYELVIDLATKE